MTDELESGTNDGFGHGANIYIIWRRKIAGLIACCNGPEVECERWIRPRRNLLLACEGLLPMRWCEGECPSHLLRGASHRTDNGRGGLRRSEEKLRVGTFHKSRGHLDEKRKIKDVRPGQDSNLRPSRCSFHRNMFTAVPSTHWATEAPVKWRSQNSHANRRKTRWASDGVDARGEGLCGRNERLRKSLTCLLRIGECRARWIGGTTDRTCIGKDCKTRARFGTWRVTAMDESLASWPDTRRDYLKGKKSQMIFLSREQFLIRLLILLVLMFVSIVRSRLKSLSLRNSTGRRRIFS